jgi:hypothetical protein
MYKYILSALTAGLLIYWLAGGNFERNIWLGATVFMSLAVGVFAYAENKPKYKEEKNTHTFTWRLPK